MLEPMYSKKQGVREGAAWSSRRVVGCMRRRVYLLLAQVCCVSILCCACVATGAPVTAMPSWRVCSVLRLHGARRRAAPTWRGVLFRVCL